jgi:hypothetical protein
MNPIVLVTNLRRPFFLSQEVACSQVGRRASERDQAVEVKSTLGRANFLGCVSCVCPVHLFFLVRAGGGKSALHPESKSVKGYEMAGDRIVQETTSSKMVDSPILANRNHREPMKPPDVADRTFPLKKEGSNSGSRSIGTHTRRSSPRFAYVDQGGSAVPSARGVSGRGNGSPMKSLRSKLRRKDTNEATIPPSWTIEDSVSGRRQKGKRFSPDETVGGDIVGERSDDQSNNKTERKTDLNGTLKPGDVEGISFSGGKHSSAAVGFVQQALGSYLQGSPSIPTITPNNGNHCQHYILDIAASLPRSPSHLEHAVNSIDRRRATVCINWQVQNSHYGQRENTHERSSGHACSSFSFSV